MDDFGAVNAVYARFFGAHRPARSCVEVARLPLGALFEIECVVRCVRPSALRAPRRTRSLRCSSTIWQPGVEKGPQKGPGSAVGESARKGSARMYVGAGAAIAERRAQCLEGRAHV